MLSRTLSPALVATLAACSATQSPTTEPVASRVGPQIAPFDLVCKSQTADSPVLTFHIVRAEDGAAIVATMNDQPLVDYETHTYMNAYMWTNGKVRYTVDRASGVLTTKPEGLSYDCERKGVQRF